MKRLSASLGLVVLLVVLLACKKGEGGKCFHNKDCKDNLVCSLDKGECMTYEALTSACAKTGSCEQHGDCKVSSVAADEVAGCTAKSDDDCKQAACAKQGCTYHAETHNCY